MFLGLVPLSDKNWGIMLYLLQPGRAVLRDSFFYLMARSWRSRSSSSRSCGSPRASRNVFNPRLRTGPCPSFGPRPLDRVPTRAARCRRCADVTFDLEQGETIAIIASRVSARPPCGGLIRLSRAAPASRGRDPVRRREASLRRSSLWTPSGFAGSVGPMRDGLSGSAFRVNPVITIWSSSSIPDARTAWAQAQGPRPHKGAVGPRAFDPKAGAHAYPHRAIRRHAAARTHRDGPVCRPANRYPREPTTALDILTQARDHRSPARASSGRLGFSTIFISHDLSIAAELADRAHDVRGTGRRARQRRRSVFTGRGTRIRSA